MMHEPFTPPAVRTPSPQPSGPGGPRYTYGEPLYTVPPVKVHAGLGIAGIVLAVVWTVVQLTQTMFAPQAAAAYARAATLGLSPSQSALTTYDLVGILVAPVALAAWVVSGVWLYKSRVTAQGANPSFVHERSKVWAWLGWAVPLVNLWFPYQVVRDVRRATSPRAVNGIGWWWAAWLVGYFVGESADKTSSRTSPGLSELASNIVVPLEVVSSVGMVVALVLWIRIVREITAWQRERLAEQAGANSY